MEDTKLILVTGMSGAGKSTTSKSLARQLRLNGVHCRWLHEEMKKQLILDPSGYRHCQDRGLAGAEGVYSMWQDYQDLSNAMFERVTGRKLKIDTTGGQYDSHMRRLTTFLGLDFVQPVEKTVAAPQQFLGRYAVQIAGSQHSIEICSDSEGLFCRAFWPYMKLRPLGGRQFEFCSFPVKLTFHKDESGQVGSVAVTGEYDWDIVGTTMLRILS